MTDGDSLRRSNDGSEVRVLEKTDISAPQATGWKFPEPFQGKAADGTTDLYALIWRPSNFDPSKKYPIVEHVYTGPQDFFVPKTFGGMLRLQSMAELGFVVVMIDGRGTTGRSRAFHLFSYRNLGRSFEDHVAMIKQMAAHFPYMDADRVGIFGTSAGGYGAAHAMLVFPEFYKVGVSISGDHDARRALRQIPCGGRSRLDLRPLIRPPVVIRGRVGSGDRLIELVDRLEAVSDVRELVALTRAEGA